MNRNFFNQKTEGRYYLLLLLIIQLNLTSCKNETAKFLRTFNLESRQEKLIRIGKEILLKELQSPSTTKFINEKIIIDKSSRKAVYLCVDSQNLYGSMIRSFFVVYFLHDSLQSKYQPVNTYQIQHNVELYPDLLKSYSDLEVFKEYDYHHNQYKTNDRVESKSINQVSEFEKLELELEEIKSYPKTDNQEYNEYMNQAIEDYINSLNAFIGDVKNGNQEKIDTRKINEIKLFVSKYLER